MGTTLLTNFGDFSNLEKSAIWVRLRTCSKLSVNSIIMVMGTSLQRSSYMCWCIKWFSCLRLRLVKSSLQLIPTTTEPLHLLNSRKLLCSIEEFNEIINSPMTMSGDFQIVLVLQVSCAIISAFRRLPDPP